MSIDPKTLREGTIVTLHGNWFGRVEETDPTDEITGAFVPVPEGMTVEDAERALADARPWVPVRDIWPDGIPVGVKVRVREEWVSGEYAGPQNMLIHPDDAPQDPDADLIEAMAKAVLDNFHGPDNKHPSWHLNPETVARAALAVVREHEAKP